MATDWRSSDTPLLHHIEQSVLVMIMHCICTERKKKKLQACIHAMCFHGTINLGNKYVPALKIISSCNGPNTINRTDFTRSHRVVNQRHTTRVAWTSMVQKNEQLFKKLLNEWKKNEKKWIHCFQTWSFQQKNYPSVSNNILVQNITCVEATPGGM